MQVYMIFVHYVKTVTGYLPNCSANPFVRFTRISKYEF